MNTTTKKEKAIQFLKEMDIYAPAPFDKDRIYPLQRLVTQYAFKRY